MAYLIKNSDGEVVIRNDKEVIGMDLNDTVKDVNEDKRILTITGSDQSVDRDGDVIQVSGWRLDNYVKNPVFLWAHQYGVPPIGVSTKVVKRKSPMRLDFDIKFMEEGINHFGDMIFRMFHQKFMNASSVGFMPWKWEPIKQEEPKENERGFWSPRKYIDQELLELSAVPVPSNPNAVQNALKGMSSLSDCTKIGLMETFNGKKPFELEEGKYNMLWDMASEMAKNISFEEEKEIQVQVPENITSEEEDEEFKTIAHQEEFNPLFYDKEGNLLDNVEMIEELKPYKNEHACRLKEPDEYDSFARKNCDQYYDDKCIDVIYGIKNDKVEVQALRYNKEIWTKEDALKHCESKKGTFEPALEEEGFVPLFGTNIISIEEIKKINPEVGKALEEIFEKDIWINFSANEGELLEAATDERINTVLSELEKIKELIKSSKFFSDQENSPTVLDDETSIDEQEEDVFEKILGEELIEDVGNRLEKSVDNEVEFEPTEELVKQLGLLNENVKRKITKILKRK